MIKIKDIETALTEALEGLETLHMSSVYEKIEGDDAHLKLVVFFQKNDLEDVNVLYTKLIFLVDTEKITVTKNYFLYLYDINCQYKTISFDDLSDFKKKIRQIFENSKV